MQIGLIIPIERSTGTRPPRLALLLQVQTAMIFHIRSKLVCSSGKIRRASDWYSVAQHPISTTLLSESITMLKLYPDCSQYARAMLRLHTDCCWGITWNEPTYQRKYEVERWTEANENHPTALRLANRSAADKPPSYFGCVTLRHSSSCEWLMGRDATFGVSRSRFYLYVRWKLRPPPRPILHLHLHVFCLPIFLSTMRKLTCLLTLEKSSS